MRKDHASQILANVLGAGVPGIAAGGDRLSAFRGRRKRTLDRDESCRRAVRRWRMTLYIMPNDPEALLERVAKDFPNTVKLKEKRVPAEGN